MQSIGHFERGMLGSEARCSDENITRHRDDAHRASVLQRLGIALLECDVVINKRFNQHLGQGELAGDGDEFPASMRANNAASGATNAAYPSRA